MTWKEITSASLTLQALYRLALSVCAAAIFLGAWDDINHHPALLAAILVLFIYQSSSYFMVNERIPLRQWPRLTVIMGLIDGLITGLLLALVGYDPIIVLGLGLMFLVTTIGHFKATLSLELVGVFIGAGFSTWLLPLSISPSAGSQLFILMIGVGYALLQTNMARHIHVLLVDQHHDLLRQNEWLTLHTFRLSKYLSPAVNHAILTGKHVLTKPQEKALTIFFSDIEGFTKLAEDLNAEQLTDLLNTYLTEMSEIAVRFGGTIDKVIGDSIMVFFGDPISRGVEADAVACLSMAIAMKRAMSHLQARWYADGIVNPPALRMGINSGICKVGNFGTENRLNYTLLGRAVNLASRLESSAKSGEILISKDTYNLVKDAVHCVAQGPIPIKGFAETVDVYSAIDLHKHLKSDCHPQRQRHAIA